MKIETRDARLPVEIRDGEPGRPRKLVGYAARFGAESSVLYEPEIGAFVEVIRPGAFARTLRENPDIRALGNHDTSLVLGRTKNGTLRLWEDEEGLAFEDQLPPTSYARDIEALVEGGYVDGCSFGFSVVEDQVETRSGLPSVRTLIDVDLFEVSLSVAFPAYEASTVAVRHRRAAPSPSRPRLDLARRKLRYLALKP